MAQTSLLIVVSLVTGASVAASLPDPEHCWIHPWADGVQIRAYHTVKSADWDNERGDCQMTLADFQVFGAAYGASAAGCMDPDNSGSTDLLDFTMFGTNWLRHCTSAP